ncbi:MAG: ATP-binding cassette domain-containing protein [Rikenellaceae bacterium]
MVNNIIKIDNGIARQSRYQILKPLNLTIDEGEQIAIIGANGSGKSIVASIIAGSIPLKGEGVKYNFGTDRTSRISENIVHLAFRDSYGIADRGYYHQQRWNSFDREDQPLVKDKIPPCENLELQRRIFDLFGIDEMLTKEMILLSSGELRKFQLTKALLKDPKILLLEDPFIGLDITTREALRDLLQKIIVESSLQVILVLSKQTDIPPFTTHILPMVEFECRKKVTLEEFRHSADFNAAQLPSFDIKQRILSLPDKISTNNSNEVINLNHVTIKYDNHTILNNLSWRIEKGEQWALSGDNGAGKSTLLSLIFADIPQGYSCDIRRFGRKQGTGESIWDIKRNIGYVSPEMHRAYCESIPSIEIVASGLHDTVGLYKKMKEEEREVCLFWMDIFGASHLQERDFMTLSSGEQRLVLLARAFVKDPELLILDEPLHGLDPQNRGRVLDIVEAFSSRQNKSIIYVSHYQEELPTTITNSLHLTRHRK